MPSERRVEEAKLTISKITLRAPAATVLLYDAITWRSPFTSVVFSVAAIFLVGVFVGVVENLPIASLVLISVAVRLAWDSLPGLPPSPADATPDALPARYSDAVNSLAEIVATLGESEDLLFQQISTRPLAFSLQAIAALLIAAWVFSKIPSAAILWIAVLVLLIVPGCVSQGVFGKAQAAAQPPVHRASQTIISWIEGFEKRFRSNERHPPGGPGAL